MMWSGWDQNVEEKMRILVAQELSSEDTISEAVTSSSASNRHRNASGLRGDSEFCSFVDSKNPSYEIATHTTMTMVNSAPLEALQSHECLELIKHPSTKQQSLASWALYGAGPRQTYAEPVLTNLSSRPWQTTIFDLSDSFLSFNIEDDDPLMGASFVEVPEVTNSEDLLSDNPPAADSVPPASVAVPPSPKSPRKRNLDISDLALDDGDDGPRFREFQEDQWVRRFDELCDYRRAHGHCLVPHRYEANPELARWVKRQRYQYKLLAKGRRSTVTPDRLEALNAIGFAWDSQSVTWAERLQELQAFRARYGHCSVPTNCAGHKQLATWIKCQRRQYKLLREDRPSNMTVERIAALEAVGMQWEARTTVANLPFH